jgi:hypothetical protein
MRKHQSARKKAPESVKNQGLYVWWPGAESKKLPQPVPVLIFYNVDVLGYAFGYTRPRNHILQAQIGLRYFLLASSSAVGWPTHIASIDQPIPSSYMRGFISAFWGQTVN